ncbi:MAG TPA: RsmE family RNA methyltransferase [Armatimonadota bacterium]|nr:RsmE family RNA methyltransferase [Armatimonadota bacterium]
MSFTHILISPEEYCAPVIELRGEKYHHLARVRRVRVGTELHAALPDGRMLIAEVTEITSECLRALVSREEIAEGQSPCHVTLFQAVLKGEKMDFVVQKACELGVTTLVPLMAKHSIPRWNTAQAVERAGRWQRIADAAAEQCERNIPMAVESPTSVSSAVTAYAGVALLLHERHGRSLQHIAAEHTTVTDLGIFIGPEGGWDTNEEHTLLTAGGIPIHLGSRVLRAETASFAAVTLAQYLWGDLSRSLES